MPVNARVKEATFSAEARRGGPCGLKYHESGPWLAKVPPADCLGAERGDCGAVSYQNTRARR
jgi:hypothetical protein